MGFFDALRQRSLERAARRWGKWLARVMLWAFMSVREHYKGVAPTFAWLARKTLLTRSHWRQVDETTFLFEKSGETIQITDDMNLLQVTHLEVDVEYGHELRTTHLPPWQQAELLLLAHHEVDQHMRPR